MKSKEILLQVKETVNGLIKQNKSIRGIAKLTEWPNQELSTFLKGKNALVRRMHYGIAHMVTNDCRQK